MLGQMTKSPHDEATVKKEVIISSSCIILYQMSNPVIHCLKVVVKYLGGKSINEVASKFLSFPPSQNKEAIILI